MKLLALDTSSTACTVAVQVDDVVVSRHEEQAREHTRLLMLMIKEVLDEAQVELPDLDAIVLGNGPGSFIGMRIAASVAQGLAHGAGLEIRPVSSLAAVAAQVFVKSDADRVAVAQDAHMNEVYLGLYQRGDNGLPVAVAPERLQPQAIIGECSEGKWVAAGFGWHRFPELAALNENCVTGEQSVLYPDARFLMQLAAGVDSIPPNEVEPAYLRQKVAEKPGVRTT